MSYRRLNFLVIVTLAIVGGSYLFLNDGGPSSEAPAGVSIGLEDSLPAYGVNTTDALIEFWRGQFERAPQDYISLTYLGHTFIRKARETGDISVYERAEATLRKALELNPNYESARAYLSAVLIVKHDFQGALDLANRVYSFDSRALQALATLGDAHLELGNYADAEAAYMRLLERNPSPAVYSRLARLVWLQGRPVEALDYTQRAADEAMTLGLTWESVAWYQFQLGELYFNIGQTENAAKYQTAALDLFDNYYLALAGLGKVRAAQGRNDEAIDLYERAVAIIPQPANLAALGDLYAKTGNKDKALLQYDTVEFIGKLAAINQQIYNRNLVLFYADHDLKVEETLVLARTELVVRKDIYGYDTLAWALYKNGLYDEAAKAITEAMKLGTQDANLYYHAGMIYNQLGDKELAQEHLERALELNPHFSILQADEARRALAGLSKEVALSDTQGGTTR